MDANNKIIGIAKQEEWNWSSYNEDIAIIDTNGIVTAKEVGDTVITAKNAKLGKTAKAIINVYRNIEGEITVPQVAQGNNFTVTLKADGTVWMAGNNEYGQLGNGTTTNSNETIQVKVDVNTYLKNISKIAVGESHILALTTEGEVYAWGRNNYGQLGQSNTNNLSYATKVKGGLTNIVDITAGTYHSIAITSSGEMYVWGDNRSRQLGIENTTQSLVPIKNKMKNAIKAVAGVDYTIALRTDGTLWGTGNNEVGQLGLEESGIGRQGLVSKITNTGTGVYAGTMEIMLDGNRNTAVTFGGYSCSFRLDLIQSVGIQQITIDIGASNTSSGNITIQGNVNGTWKTIGTKSFTKAGGTIETIDIPCSGEVCSSISFSCSLSSSWVPIHELYIGVEPVITNITNIGSGIYRGSMRTIIDKNPDTFVHLAGYLCAFQADFAEPTRISEVTLSTTAPSHTSSGNITIEGNVNGTWKTIGTKSFTKEIRNR